MKIGLISDTHGYLDPAVPRIFAEVEHILHGGDVGPYSILHQLEQIAPVTAVFGNTDGPELGLREVEVVELDGVKFLLKHIVDVSPTDPEVLARARRSGAGVVLFGHTHRPFESRAGDVLLVNPGYAGRQRFDLKRSVAILEVEGGHCRVNYIGL